MRKETSQPFIVLSVDLGAESGRVAATRFEAGGVELQILHRFEHQAFQEDDGLHWDIEGIWKGILEGLEHARSLRPRPLSLGVDGWGVDYVLLDSLGGLIRAPYSYRDPRGARGLGRLAETPGLEQLYRQSGIQVQPFNTISQLKAHSLDHPGDFERASSLLLLPDYLHFRLCGVLSTEYSNASTTQLMTPGSPSWNPALCAAAGLPRRLLQPIRAAGEVLGLLRPELQARFDLPGLKIILPPTHDTAAAVAACPATVPGWAFLSSGTWSLMGVERAEPLVDEGARLANFSNEGRAGGGIRFLKNIMGLWLAQRLRAELAPGSDYASLMDLAAAAPARLSLIDAASPRFLNPSSMASEIRAFCRESGQPSPESLGALLRCCLDSLALEYRHTRAALERLRGGGLTRLHVIGGGVQNRLLAQMTAEATGLELYAGPVEAAALGNALFQALGLGRLGSHAEGRALLASSFPPELFQPRFPALWDAAYHRYLHLKERVHA